MFEKFFGLTENPFNLTPDPKYLYLSEVHKEAIAHLRYGINERKGFVLITGEVGAGKTTICRALLSTLSSQTRTALILNPSLSDIELLQTINQEFGIPATYASKKALLDELYAFLLKVRAEGENVVLIIDECQNLAPDVLEQIRMLSNLETEKEKLLQIILIGQPELNAILASPYLRQINDRIVLRYHMGMLSRADTRDYIAHRLMISGSHGDIKFMAQAIRRIYQYSKGLPRRINALAERALLIAFLKGTRKINGPIVVLAIRELKGEYERDHTYRKFLIPLSAACAIVVFLLILWRPNLSGILGERNGIAKTNDLQKQRKEFLIVRDDWIIGDYDTSLALLYQLPGAQSGTGTLNLHPAPEYLQNIDRAFIASVAGGYCVIHHAGPESVWVIARDKALLELPLKRFSEIYKWNIMARFPRGGTTEIYRLAHTGERVKWLQTILKERGYFEIEPDGIYGVETASGIERLQETYGLKRDGVAGVETLELIRILEKTRTER